MRIRHINESDKDFIEYTSPIYEKYNGIFGYLIIDVNRKIYFIYSNDDYTGFENVTHNYIIED